MTNPADVLTDEFIERVASHVHAICAGGHAVSVSPVVLNVLRRVLIEEREPVQTVVFEVRAPDFESAISKLHRIANGGGYWEARSDIRIRDEQV
jgi:hypothetical protein